MVSVLGPAAAAAPAHGLLASAHTHSHRAALQSTTWRSVAGCCRPSVLDAAAAHHRSAPLYLRAVVVRPATCALTHRYLAGATARAGRVSDRTLAEAPRDAPSGGQALGPRRSGGLHRRLHHRGMAAHGPIGARRVHPTATVRGHLAAVLRAMASSQLWRRRRQGARLGMAAAARVAGVGGVAA